MLTSIFSILSSMSDFFSLIGTGITLVFRNIAQVVAVIRSIVSQLPTFLSWLPINYIGGLLSVMLTVVFVYKILGRT